MSTTKILRRDRQRKAEKVAERRDHRILRLREVESRCGLKRSSIYQAIAAGSFPKSLSITGHAVGWLDSEVEDWIASRVAERDQPERRTPARL
jgi:prophage regulatory protein